MKKPKDKPQPVVVANGYGEYEIYTPLPRQTKKKKGNNKNEKR